MDYEQKYKEVLEIGKALHKNGAYRLLMEDIFPELKESEDERIRKAIICYIGYGQHCGVSNIDMIAWLEKQNKQILANSAKTCKDEQKLSNLESNGEDLSKEDEVKINRIVGFIENLDIPDNDILRKDAAWLKTLKERLKEE